MKYEILTAQLVELGKILNTKNLSRQRGRYQIILQLIPFYRATNADI